MREETEHWDKCVLNSEQFHTLCTESANITIFTQIWDVSNLTAQIKHVCQGKMYLSKSKMIPQKIKHLLRYFTHIHKVHLILSTFTNQCHYLHLHTKCLYLPYTQSSSLPFHNISVPSTALYIQHFLQSFTIISGETCCHAIMIRTD